MKAKVLVGVSASGKSTLGAELCKQGWLTLDRDDLRFSLTKTKDWREYKFDKRVEAVITDMHSAALESAFNRKMNVCIAETNLTPKSRRKWLSELTTLGFEVEFVPMHITLYEAMRRNDVRDNGLPQEVILKQWVNWEFYLKTLEV